MTTSNNTTLTSKIAVLTALRALAPEPPGSIADALTAIDTQAMQLQGLLANQSEQLPLSISRLIPNIIVEHIDYIPVSGTSFWANGHWHIHIRASDPINFQSFTALHQLKHIIDYPVRQKSITFSEADWETMADYFATQVLMVSRELANSQRERGNAYGSSR